MDTSVSTLHPEYQAQDPREGNGVIWREQGSLKTSWSQRLRESRLTGERESYLVWVFFFLFFALFLKIYIKSIN